VLYLHHKNLLITSLGLAFLIDLQVRLHFAPSGSDSYHLPVNHASLQVAWEWCIISDLSITHKFLMLVSFKYLNGNNIASHRGLIDDSSQLISNRIICVIVSKRNGNHLSVSNVGLIQIIENQIDRSIYLKIKFVFNHIETCFQ
jgi:hypothetical protein